VERLKASPVAALRVKVGSLQCVANAFA